MVEISQAVATGIAIQLLILFLIVRRAYYLSVGATLSVARLAFLPVLVLFLTAANVAESFLAIPWTFPYLIAVDVALLIVGGFLGETVARRTATIRGSPSAGWTVQIGMGLILAYVGIYIFRLAVAIAFFPAALSFESSSTTASIPLSQQLALATLDAAYSLSAGLLVGRSVGIYRRWRQVEAAPSSGG